MLLANLFDSKIVDNQGKSDGPPLVHPQTGSGLALWIAMFLQSFGEELLCDDPCLGGSVHAFLDFAVYVSVWDCYVAQFVMLNDVVRYVHKFQSHVFIPGHWGIQIEIVNIHCEESRARSGYDAVDEELDGK
jgi:hypothetical protein